MSHKFLLICMSGHLWYCTQHCEFYFLRVRYCGIFSNIIGLCSGTLLLKSFWSFWGCFKPLLVLVWSSRLFWADLTQFWTSAPDFAWYPPSGRWERLCELQKLFSLLFSRGSWAVVASSQYPVLHILAFPTSLSTTFSPSLWRNVGSFFGFLFPCSGLKRISRD